MTMPPRRASRGRGGPPRKADNRTGSSPAFARAVALRLPDVEESSRRGRTTFSVKGAPFLTLEPGEVAAAGDTRIELGRVNRDEVRSLIEAAWMATAAAPAVTAWKRKRSRVAKVAPVTEDEVRAFMLSLPGVSEGPVWGSLIGFRIFVGEKRKSFARFGPGINNLLPPDDADALLLFYCDHRPALLEDQADRFFITPHYGNPDEPGGVITRLSETSRDDLDELFELIEDAWRHVAPRSLIEQWEAEQGS